MEAQRLPEASAMRGRLLATRSRRLGCAVVALVILAGGIWWGTSSPQKTANRTDSAQAQAEVSGKRAPSKPSVDLQAAAPGLMERPVEKSRVSGVQDEKGRTVGGEGRPPVAMIDEVTLLDGTVGFGVAFYKVKPEWCSSLVARLVSEETRFVIDGAEVSNPSDTAEVRGRCHAAKEPTVLVVYAKP